MGAYGHSRMRHFFLGSTTSEIVRGMLLPVLLFR
ncbi:MAG: universal stress protein [Opitutaceae bacterium]|nr:universal stress protein [Opitutaceae bacterium]